MSLVTKALSNGIGRVFSLPRLSIPLILTLGLTLGAVLTVIAISSALLLKPLQGVDNESLIKTVEYDLVLSEELQVSYWNFRRLAGIEQAFGDLGTWAAINAGEQEISIDNINYASTQFTASNTILDVLGTKLLFGDDVKMTNPEKYVWLSNSLWKTAYSSDKSVIGRQITINDNQLIIAGIIEDLMAVNSSEPVLPEQIWQIRNIEKLNKDPEAINISNELEYLLLKTHDNSISAPSKDDIDQWLVTYITENTTNEVAPVYLTFIQGTKTDYQTRSYRSAILGDSSTLITALFFAVLGLLLMATLNLLNLFIAHYQGRTKEFAIQLSLGASLFKVRFMVMLENFPSFLLAAITGLLVAGWGIQSLPLIAGNNLPMIETINIDTAVIISALITIIILNVLFSALALVDIDKQALTNNLNSSGKGIQAQSNQYISRGLMIFQLAIASVLLTASVMLALQSFQSVYRDLGYNYEGLYQVSVNIEDEASLTEFLTYEQYANSEIKGIRDNISQYIEEKIAGSEVIIAGQGALSTRMTMSMYTPEDNPDRQVMFQSRTLSPKFFDAFSIKFLAGSNITAEQISQNERRIVIDESMAYMLFPDLPLDDLIGKSVLLDSGEAAQPVIINGIVPVTQSRAGSTSALNIPAVYSADPGVMSQLSFIVKIPNNSHISANKLSGDFNKKFPLLSNIEIRSLEDIWQNQTLNQRVSLWIVLAMTCLTLLLAAIGVAGLTQMTTNHRKYELAVRMATGAKQSLLVKFILKDALWMLVIGLGLGFAISVFGYEQLKNNLTMLPEFNGLAMSLLDLGLVVIVLISVIIPAWRVISSDPMQALRED